MKKKQYKMKKKQLNSAFAELRKLGYFAKQNHRCCQSCGWAVIPEEQEKMVVFYHKQDADNLKESGECHLAWSGNGKVITDVLTKHGITVNWDGNPDKRIKIDIN